MKVASAVNYYLSNSNYIQEIFKTVHKEDSEDVIRWAIIRTMEDLMDLHRKATWLPNEERVKSIGYLSVNKIDKTSFAFTIEVTTFSKHTFNIALERL